MIGRFIAIGSGFAAAHVAAAAGLRVALVLSRDAPRDGLQHFSKHLATEIEQWT
jgi:hypothetical protein